MKVTVCPKCNLTPEISPKQIKCPKCGRFSVGESLTESVMKWNDGEVSNEKPVKVVVKDEEVLKEEIKEEVKGELEEEVKPVKRTPKKRGTR